MSDSPKQALHPAETANDRFKRKASNSQPFGVIVAVLVHFAVFAFFPRLHAADLTTVDDAIEALDLPEEVRIPPPPEEIRRPAMPIAGAVDLADDPLPPTTWDANPPQNLAPPPTGRDLGDRPPFIPFEVAPKLENVSEIQRLLERAYPSQLREAGVEGSVVLWIFVDERGRVRESRVHTSSGHAEMDGAAQSVADDMRFTPALNRDKKTPMWISQRIRFELGHR